MLGSYSIAKTSGANKPVESAHRPGPNGLESWTESYRFADGQRYPTELVIARRGHVIRRIRGNPFVWKWMFWENGKQVAYESGSLHFNLNCTLVDIVSGRELATHDCFSELSEDAPKWEKALQNDP